jgi:hypothetical protein
MNFDGYHNYDKNRESVPKQNNRTCYENLFAVDDRIIKGIVTTFIRVPFYL